MADTARELRALLTPVAEGAGFDLEDVAVRPMGRKKHLTVTVDADSVDADGLAELSRLISSELDQVDLMGTQPYTLEVTSRGVGAPLTQPRHWRRNVGRLVRVRLRDGGETSGRIQQIDGTAVRIDDELVPFDAIESAVVQIDFGGGN